MTDRDTSGAGWSWIDALVISCFAAATLLILAWANDYIFGEENMRFAAKGLIAGKSYSSIEPERQNIDEYIKLMPRKDIVVLGSSRMLPVSAASFPGNSFANLAMSHARFEDTAVSYNLLFEAEKLPRVVILTFEDWVFNANNRLNQWSNWGDALERAKARIGYVASPKPCRNQTIIACLDGLYAVSAKMNPKGLQRLLKHVFDKGHLPSREELVAEIEVASVEAVGWQADRSYQYGFRGEAYRSDSVKKWKRSDAMKESYNQTYYSGFTRLDETQLSNIEKLLVRMREDGVTPVLFFPPMHPEAYATLPSDPMGMLALESEKRLAQLARRLGITVIGSNDPASCQAGAQGFVDAIHLRLGPMRDCLLHYRRMLEALTGPMREGSN